MAVTVIKDLEQGAAALRAAALRGAATTIGQLAGGDGRVYRHPDSAQISYPLTVQTALGSVPPQGEVISVAIIGAGPAGIAALYELRQVALTAPGRLIQAVIFETDASNFLFTPRPVNPSVVTPRRAGRVSSYYTPATVYEIGAMRFPEIAGMTWHYAERAFGADKEVNVFPNPGTVPTEFVFGSRFDHYVGKSWLDPNSPTRTVRDLVIAGLTGPTYMIGPYTPLQLIELLKNPDAPPQDLENVQKVFWPRFIGDHDGTTLEAAVRFILTNAQRAGQLPAVAGLTGAQLLDWCVELFGRFGFGTGGFKPLYNISLVEMMRLVLWDYSNEYSFPPSLAPGNVDFIAQLYDLARTPTPSNNFRVTAVRARVSDVFHRDNPRMAGVGYYDSNSAIKLATFSHAIIALPHDAATAMVNRLGYSPLPLNDPAIGDFGKIAHPGFGVLPALLLSTQPGGDAINARAVTAVSMLHMTRSSKVFSTITNLHATEPPVPQFENAPISAVVSDCGLAATYLVPSPTHPSNFHSFLVSYTWDDDSTKLENTFAQWPQNISPPGAPSMFEAMLNRAYRQNPATPGDPNTKWWLYTVLAKSAPPDRVSWDWSTYITAGGFKLDMTGDTNQSDLCFRYHTHAQYNKTSLPPTQRLDSRVFIASCSFSHLGGWLEGAFMSAVNAVAGVVVSLNQGDVNRLNPEARKLFTTLTPVIPMN
jgi:tryptophan 2-monooxygenase